MLELPTDVLLAFTSLNFPGQALDDLQPGGLHGVVDGDGVDVRAGHGQVHASANAWCGLRLVFQHHLGGAYRNKQVQLFEFLAQPSAQLMVPIEATELELEVHNGDVSFGG